MEPRSGELGCAVGEKNFQDQVREKKKTLVEHQQLGVEQRDDEHLGLLVLLLQTLANLVVEEAPATSLEDSGAVVNIDTLLFPL